MISPASEIPDFFSVFAHGAVGGEDAGLGDVRERHLREGALVAVDLGHAALGLRIALEVGDGHIGVRGAEAAGQQRGHDIVEPLAERAGGQHLQRALEAGGHEFARVVAAAPEGLDLPGGHAEEEHVLVPDLLADLDVRAVERAERHGAVEHELHVARARGLLGGKADLLGDVCRGDEPLGGRDVVVLDHDDLAVGACVHVRRDDVTQADDGVDDVLGDGVGRRGLGTKDYRDGTLGQAARLDVEIGANRPEEVELLALVLVEALCLHVEDRVGIDPRPLVSLEPIGETPLSVALHLRQPTKEVIVVEVGEKAPELARVRLPALAVL